MQAAIGEYGHKWTSLPTPLENICDYVFTQTFALSLISMIIINRWHTGIGMNLVDLVAMFASAESTLQYSSHNDYVYRGVCLISASSKQSAPRAIGCRLTKLCRLHRDHQT